MNFLYLDAFDDQDEDYDSDEFDSEDSLDVGTLYDAILVLN